MPQYFTGDGQVNGYRLQAGNGSIGSISLYADVSNFGSINIGEAFGSDGTGSLSIAGGSNVTFEYQGAGVPAGGYGVGGRVGISGGTGTVARGYLEVTGGSTVAFNNYAVDDGNGFLSSGYYNLNIGRRAGGFGEVEVSGAGSLLTASGGGARITAGRDGGVGHIDISDGGILGTFNLTLGRNGGRGTVVVEGAGSEVRLGFDYGFYGTNYAGGSGYSSIGREFNGRGILAMFDGGATRVENVDGVNDGAFFRFGRDQDSFGYGIVSGAGSRLDLIQHGTIDTAADIGAELSVGQGGRGILAVENGGEVNVLGANASIHVGRGRNSSTESLESQLVLRSGATVTVDSRDAGAATAAGGDVIVGNAAGLSGKLVVDGMTTSLNIISDNISDAGAAPGTQNYGAALIVGSNGNGRLEVTNGGTISVDGNDDVFPAFVVGNGRDGAASSGYALVSGSGSSVSVTGTRGPGTPYSAIGEAGFIGIGHRDGKTGTLVVEDGGTVANTGYNSASQIGGNTGATGTVIVDGATSSFSGGDLMAIGADIDYLNAVFEFANGGNGTLTLVNGGVAGANLIGIGDTGTLNLDGTLIGDVEVTGQVNVGGRDAIATGTIVGIVDATSGSVVFEALDLITGADRLSITGTLAVDSDDIFVDFANLSRAETGNSAVLLDLGDTTGAPLASDFNLMNVPTGLTASVSESGGQYTLTVTGAPDKSVGFLGGDVSVTEGDPGDDQSVVLTIVRSGDLSTTMNVTVDIVADTADLSDLEAGTPSSAVVQFAIGQDTIQLAGLIEEDDIFEGDESLSVVISAAITGDASPVTIFDATTTLTIIDDDLAPSTVTSGSVVGGGAFHFVQIDPKATYLRTDPSDTGALDAVALNLLTDFGVDGGEFFFASAVGDFDPFGGTAEQRTNLNGVFSTSTTLLTSNLQNRVPDALPFGGYFPFIYTLPNAPSGYVTDIPEDGGIFQRGFTTGTLNPAAPGTATYLFVSANDSFFGDNTDADGNFGIVGYSPFAVGASFGDVGSATLTGESRQDASIAIGLGGGQGDMLLEDTDWNVAGRLWVGQNNFSSGRLVLTHDSRVTVDDPGTYAVTTHPGVLIGNQGGIGYVAVTNGSTLRAGSDFEIYASGEYFGGYNNVVVGSQRGTGTLTVEGEGSLVEATGTSNRIRVGFDNGDGELNIRDGGVVKTLTLTAGRRGGEALVNITGQGSLLHLTNEGGLYGNPLYAGSGGFSSIGRDGGSGFVRLSDGGRILAENIDGVTDAVAIRLGRDYGSDGAMEIVGAGSGIDIIQRGIIDDNTFATGAAFYVGQGGQGELTLSQGADMLIQGDSARLSVARGRDGLGAAEASELEILSGSSILVDAQNYGSNIPFFDNYGNFLYNRNGGGRIDVANGQNTNGSILVDGTGSSLVVRTDAVQPNGDYSTADFTVGSFGTGRLTVSNGGYVGARELSLAQGYFNNGVQGYAGRGYLSIESGGTVTLTAPNNPALPSDPDNLPNAYRGLRMATADNTYARADIDGAGSVLTVQGGAGRMDIGRRGEAHLNITNGGVAQGFFIEAGRDGRGYVTVDGAGSTLISENQFGYFGYGFQNEAGFIRFGRNYGGYGRLDVTNGGTVTAKNTDGTINDIPIIEFGRRTGSEGVFVVDGVGSSLNVTMTGPSTDGLQTGFYEGPQLRFGREGGEGHGTFQNGAYGLVQGENAKIQVGRGADATGFTQRSTLQILSGSDVVVESIGNEARAFVGVGDQVNARGRLVVDGAGSTLTIASDNVDDVQSDGVTTSIGAQLQVGAYGTGDLRVTNGGQIDINGADDAYPGFLVGVSGGSIGTALVSGAGSAVTVYGNAASPTALGDLYNAGAIRIGLRDGSNGTLIIENGGVVTNSATNSLTQIGADPGSVGRVTVDGAGSALNAGQRLQIGADIDFDATSLTAGGTLPGGTGTLTITNAATVNVGSSTNIGVTGTLNLDGTLNAGTVPGLGGFSGLSLQGRINVGGDQSIGTGTITGAIENLLAPEYAFEFEGFTSGTFDVLNLDPSQFTIPIGTPEMILDMSGLGTVNVGDTAVFLDWNGAAPDPILFLNTNFVVQNAPPGVTFFIGEDLAGDWFVEVTDAPSGSVSIQGFAQTKDEGDPGDTTTYTYQVTRNGDLTQSITVDFEVVGLGANAADGADFEGGALPTGQIFFGTGATDAFITLDLAEDTDVEEDESFEVRLTGISGNQVILNDSAIGVIRNDDLPASISINSGLSVLEDDFGIGGQTLDFTVTRTGDTTGDLDVSFVIDANGATSGPDLNVDLLANPDDLVLGAPQIGTITILDGQSTGTISVEIAQDTVIEPREDITVTLTGFSGDPLAYTFGNQSGTGTIINDDGAPPVIPVGLEADVFGDPHLVTLDGLGYDFQAVGEFVLVEDTSGTNPLSVQIRTAPVEGSDLVSVISAMAADMGQGVGLMIDASRSPALLIDGVATDVPNNGATPVAAGDGQVFFDGETYTIVFGTGDALKIAVFDGFMNVCVFLDPAVRAPGSVQGLLGDADGSFGNDFALRNGDSIPASEITIDPISGVPSLDFDFLYGTYADSWRISDSESLFFYSGQDGDESTADYTDTSFPRGVLSTDVLPDEVLEAAIAAVDAAGITDPILRESAILDFALTGDAQFAAGASGVAADPEVNTVPEEAPELPTTIGITPVSTQIVEGDTGTKTAVFTIYRIGNLNQSLNVDYVIGGDVDAADFTAGTELSGSIRFVQGEETKSISVELQGDLATENDERIIASISTTANALIGASSGITTVLTDDLEPIARNDGGFIVSGSGTTVLPHAVLLVNDVDPDGDPLEVVGETVPTTNGAEVITNVGDQNSLISQGNIYDGSAPGSILQDSFEYTVSDGNGGLDTATVDFTVVVPDGQSLAGSEDSDVIFGTTTNDTILGLGEDDDIRAGDGDDLIAGGAGSDTLDGGSGSDTASYEDSDAAVIVAVNGAFAIGGDADGDTLTDIENLLGSAFADFLRGDGQANVLTGGAGADYIQGRGGDDTLNGGENDDLLEPGAGADTVDGGSGQDLLSALDAAGPVTIDLGNVALSSAGYADKTLISIEGVLGVAGFGNTLVGGGGEDLLIGGDVADSIAGAGGADILLGLGGADTISGGAGDDLILGLEGDDVLTGDAGRDLFLFEPGDGADVVTDFELPVGGSGFEDRLFFSGLGLTFADLDIAEVGGDVVIGYGTNPAAFDGSVTVEGVTLAELVPGGAQPDWILVF